MHRRDAFATAGAVTAVAATAVIAAGATFGLFGLSSGDGNPSSFPLVADAQADTTPPPGADVQAVDLPVATPAPASGSTHSPSAQPATTAHALAASAPAPFASTPAPVASTPTPGAAEPAASAPASAPAPAPSISAPTVSPPGNVGASPAPSHDGGESGDD